MCQVCTSRASDIAHQHDILAGNTKDAIPATGLADTFHQPHLSSAIRVFVSTLRAGEWSPFVVGAPCNRTIGARVGTFLLLRARFYWLVCLLATFYIHLHLTVSKHVIAH